MINIRFRHDKTRQEKGTAPMAWKSITKMLCIATLSALFIEVPVFNSVNAAEDIIVPLPSNIISTERTLGTILGKEIVQLLAKNDTFGTFINNVSIKIDAEPKPAGVELPEL